MQERKIGALLPAILFLLLAGLSCGGGSSSSTPANVAVSVNPNSSQVEAGGSVAISATVTADPAGKGVNWSLRPASGAGTLRNITSTSVEFVAPANPPSSDEAVQITATAVADPSKTAVAQVTVDAIQVSASATDSVVTAGGSTTVTAQVLNDPANKGVTWSILPATGAGTLSNATANSVVYNAPASPPQDDVAVTITGTSVSDASKNAQASITFAAIAVNVSTNDNTTIAAGGTVNLTATTTGDPSNQGVTWSVSPSSGAGTLSNATNTTVTYHAPAAIPPSDLAVTVTATSIANPTKSGGLGITVAAVQVSLTPTSAIIPLNATQAYTPTVQFDPGNQGVHWAVQQNGVTCSPACGTVAPSNTASGTAATYTAPATVPADPAVTIVASSVADSTKSAASLITVTIGTVKLVPGKLDFQHVKIGFSRTLAITLTNTGATALKVNGIAAASGASGPYSETNNCGSSVPAGGQCGIQVTFKPTTTGTFNSNISISDDSLGSPQQVPITGIGLNRIRFEAALVKALMARPLVSVPRPRGRSPVGTRVLALVDSKREDPYLRTGARRELLVRFWYPAATAAGCRLAAYTSPRVWSYFSALSGVPLPQVSTNSCQDAGVAPGRHAIAVLTHGYTGTFTDYTFLAEDLASRGYVVGAVDHTYEATAVEFPDGRFAQSAFGSHLGHNLLSDETAVSFAVNTRLEDLSFFVDELQRLDEQRSGPFRGRLDTTRIALVGHSLGGLTTILALEAEPRFRAGVVLDGTIPPRMTHAIRTPVLLLNAGKGAWGADECRLWNHLTGARLAVNLPGAEHIAPSDAVWLARGAIKTGTMHPDTAIAAMRDFMAAFLDQHLRGRRYNALPQERSALYPAIGISAGHPAQCSSGGTPKTP